MPPKNVRDASKEYKVLEKTIQNLTKAVEKGTKRMDKMEKSMKGAGNQARGANQWVRNFRNSIGGLNSEAEKSLPLFTRMGKKLSVFRSRLLIAAFGVELLRRSIGRVMGVYSKQEDAERKLHIALGFTSHSLLEYASSLQKVTKFGDEVIIDAQAQIAAFIKDEDQIKKLTKATLNLAEAKGMDLKTASDLVAK